MHFVIIFLLNLHHRFIYSRQKCNASSSNNNSLKTNKQENFREKQLHTLLVSNLWNWFWRLIQDLSIHRHKSLIGDSDMHMWRKKNEMKKINYDLSQIYCHEKCFDNGLWTFLHLYRVFHTWLLFPAFGALFLW